MGGLKRIPEGGAREIYFTDLVITTEVFANEWDKRILLTVLEEERKLFDFELYAFCILNDRVRLLTGGLNLKPSVVRQVLATLMQRYSGKTERIGEKNIIPVSASAKACVIRIEGQRDAIDVLRYIHLTPSSEGYALCAGDYWWTSLSSYRGRYCWPMVDAGTVMSALERQDSQAARSLLEYHRRAEYMHNPVPDCVKRREYHSVEWRSHCAPLGNSEENLNETFGA